MDRLLDVHLDSHLDSHLDLHLDLHLGRPLVRGSLTLFPVWNGAAVVETGYVLDATSVRVDEHGDGGVVEQLVAVNAGPLPALVLEGELLQGGKQHRLAASPALVPAAGRCVLEVRCVEQGRWGGAGGHRREGRRAPVTVRARGDQGAVWAEVARHEERWQSASPTSSLLDATAGVEERAARLVAGIRPLPFQSGVLVGIGGHPLLLEAYDSPATLARCWEPLLRAVALDALAAPAVATPGRRARRFLDQVSRVRLDRRPAGQGQAVRGRSAYVQLQALVWRDRAVQAVAVNPRHELLAA